MYRKLKRRPCIRLGQLVKAGRGQIKDPPSEGKVFAL